MPNFDGKGPLGRGRVIGRGQGLCRRKNTEGCTRKAEDRETAAQNETAEE